MTRQGFTDAGLALRLRASPSSYLVAWLGLPGWAFVILLLLLVPLLTPVYWGEEFGWTGYLRMRLFPGRPLRATLATGLVWAVWHYPLAFVGYIRFDVVPLGLLIWTCSFLAQQVLLSWLRIRSGSIWPTSLAHAGNNMVLALLTGDVLTAGRLDDTTHALVMAIPTAVVAAWIVATGRLATPHGPARRR
ncbi:CPBP family intramembrane glutamic endopeptidase [Pseudonocardia kunmingensis]|uniref:CAAX prenyl protease-like protein n=1 Tax=Pseudonocardia kunmingensis TaxID=630975 RepID=A0A543E2D0_9PSEU|nr:CPBP family intramembrane glutamic endopeptidase [Pseudonocardia kunmingensis]TQM15741.1 CAAX prenyl protease-like protein [Pseudonocardia kunmingensis]